MFRSDIVWINLLRKIIRKFKYVMFQNTKKIRRNNGKLFWCSRFQNFGSPDPGQGEGKRNYKNERESNG